MDPKLVYIGVLLNINLGLCSTDKTLGYGTKFGTVLEEDSKKVIGKQFTLFRQKLGRKNDNLDQSRKYKTRSEANKNVKKLKFCFILGLGAPPGFLNGDNEQVILDVYQRYLEYKLLQGADPNDDLCQEKCPPGSHCSSGVCFCDTGQILSSLGPSPSPISISKGTPTHHHPPLNF